MSDRERHERDRAESLKDEGDASTEETPDVEAHRFETGSEAARADHGRADQGTEPEDRHRNESV